MYAINVPYINLDQIYNSGQVFTWIKIADGKYVIPFRDNIIKVQQNKTLISFNCTEDKFYDVWWDYFDLATDYSRLNNMYKKVDLDFKIKMNRATGIHILNQDLFEIIIVSILLGNTMSIGKVRKGVYSILSKCGRKKKKSSFESGTITWYEFPKPEDIIRKQNKLLSGGKKDTIIDICENIVDGWLDLELLYDLDYKEAKMYLMDFNGINSVIADNICLYALHHLEAFPLDRFIKSIFDRDFSMGYDEFKEWFLKDSMLCNVGYLKQVLLYNEFFPPTKYNIDTEQYKSKKNKKKRKVK